jgi:hypothetical protein
MHFSRVFFSGLLLMLLAVGLFSCRDDGFDTDPNIKLSFSADSLLFDTVFTTVGSSTKYFKVFNKHHQRINISNVYLASGQQSFFRINVDGSSGSHIRDVEIPANDSIFVFVEVTIDPVNQDIPLVISESIIFNLNGNYQEVNLVAWGQDAHFIHPNYTDANGVSYHLIEENTTWTSDLPYVVYGFAVVAPQKILTIEQGAKIHFHNNSSLIFLQGSSLKVNGTMELPVVFQGNRLEPFYREQPGQWGRIWLTATSKDHEIDYAIIKNGTVGLQVDTIGSTSGPTLTIRNTIIRNHSLAGLVAQGSNVKAENLVVANCGQHAVLLAIGGTYDFRHCTFANYYNISLRQTPSVLLNNYYQDTVGVFHVRDFNLTMSNSIIYGSLQEELHFDFFQGSQPELMFNHNLLRTTRDVNEHPFFNILKNQNPNFLYIASNDYRLRENSPAIGQGDPAIALTIPFDILGHDRTQRPDLGAYQYYDIEEED